MRRLILLAAFLSCFALAGQAAKSPARTSSPTPAAKPTVSPSASPQASTANVAVRPQFRPAVLATGPDSLINRINVNELLKAGQKSGAVQFSALINADGTIDDFTTYHPLANCQALENEVGKQLVDAKFTPPIYQHQPVKALLFGTVLFDADNVPHLRILLNQDPREIEAGSDFIAPQPIIGADSKFTGLHPPADLPVKIVGVVNFAVRVSEKGEMGGAQITNEEPPLLGLADATIADFTNARFIPAFRDGDPVASEVVLAVCYKPPAEDEGTSSAPFGLQPPAPSPQP